MVRDTLIDFFHDLAGARGQFLVYDDGFRARSYSYAEVGRAARGFAARLAAAGVRKGDKVLFWSENRPEWIVAFWGCLLGGIIVVPVDYRTSPEFLARISRIVAATRLLIGEDVPPLKTAAVSVRARKPDMGFSPDRLGKIPDRTFPTGQPEPALSRVPLPALAGTRRARLESTCRSARSLS